VSPAPAPGQVSQADLIAALAPFARFFRSDEHDLSPAPDQTLVASFLDQVHKLPFAELWIADFRRAYRVWRQAIDGEVVHHTIADSDGDDGA